MSVGCIIKIKMSLKYKLKLWNYKRKFTYKKAKIFFYYLPLLAIDTIFARNPVSNLPKKGNILLIFNNVIGDTVVCTGLLRNLVELGYEVSVSSRKQSLDLLKYNPYIKETFLYNDNKITNFFYSLLLLRKKNFDLAIEVRIARKPSYKDLLYYALIKSPILIGCNKDMFKTFNVTIPCKLQQVHVIEPLRRILDIFGKNITYRDMSYDLFFSQAEEDYVASQVSEKNFIIFNPLGSKNTHCLSPKQAQCIYDQLNILGYKIFITGEKEKLSILGFGESIIFQSRNIIDIIPLVKKAKLIVSVDTSIIHIATTFNKNTIAIYPHSSKVHIPSPPQSELDLIKYNYWLYYTQMEYGLYGIPVNKISNFFSIGTVFWHPNNPNSIQIVVDYDYISKASSIDLTYRINEAIDSLEVF